MKKDGNIIINGEIAVIKRREDYYKIKKEVILFAKNTHPDLVVVIDKIRAIVVEVDNKLCHPAIIAREFKKPILMGIDDITKKFKTGDNVTIDFGQRTVRKTK